MAGTCNNKLVDPPQAACTIMALVIDASTNTSLSLMPRSTSDHRACALRVAPSSQIGCPLGAKAECGSEIPSASPTTCEVAAVPKNWQPPPGDAHARQPSS